MEGLWKGLWKGCCVGGLTKAVWLKHGEETDEHAAEQRLQWRAEEGRALREDEEGDGAKGDEGRGQGGGGDGWPEAAPRG